jgi:hypothetical protein
MMRRLLAVIVSCSLGLPWPAATAWALEQPAAPKAPCAIADLCATDKPLCEDGQRLWDKADGLAQAHAGPSEAAKPGTAEIKALTQDYQGLWDRFENVLFAKKSGKEEKKTLRCPLVRLRDKITLLSVDVVPMDLASVAGVFEGVEKRADELEAEMSGAGDLQARAEEFSARLESINSDGSRVWDHIHDSGLLVDHTGPALPWTRTFPDGREEPIPAPNAPVLATVNGLQARVAALSRRLQEMRRRLGPNYRSPEQLAKEREAREKKVADLKDPFAGKPAGGMGAGVDALPPPPGGRGAEKGYVLSEARPTLIDMKLVPAPKKLLPPPPQSTVGAVGKFFNFIGAPGLQKHEYHADPLEIERIVKRQKSGLTNTVGDPGGRAGLVYHQVGETCTIGAQVQILLDVGAVPPGTDPLKVEDALYKKALEKGYFDGASADPRRRHHGGTPWQYAGNLLDVPVRKSYDASDADLLAAVTRGNMVLVQTDTGSLWNDPRFKGGGHTVVITGAELDKKTGELLGYYINDTGTNQGGRLIAAEQFKKAWKHIMVEPL